VLALDLCVSGCLAGLCIVHVAAVKLLCPFFSIFVLVLQV